MAGLPGRQPLESHDVESGRIYSALSDARPADGIYEDPALRFSIQSWQAEEAAHLQGTDGHITEKREKLSTEALIQKILGRKPSQCPNCGFCGLLRTGLAPPTAC